MKKGFLQEAKVEAPKDADRFVLEEAQGVLEKVEDLNGEDCEETNPFRAKYQVSVLYRPGGNPGANGWFL